MTALPTEKRGEQVCKSLGQIRNTVLTNIPPSNIVLSLSLCDYILGVLCSLSQNQKLERVNEREASLGETRS